MPRARQVPVLRPGRRSCGRTPGLRLIARHAAGHRESRWFDMSPAHTNFALALRLNLREGPPRRSVESDTTGSRRAEPDAPARRSSRRRVGFHKPTPDTAPGGVRDDLSRSMSPRFEWAESTSVDRAGRIAAPRGQSAHYRRAACAADGGADQAQHIGASQEIGALRFSNTSLGTIARPLEPATSRRSCAPITPDLLW
jgi:hypothetical protein